MCNLYSVTPHPRGNWSPISAGFGGQSSWPSGCLSRHHGAARGGERELTMMHWGFPPPNLGQTLVTNVRNLKSPYWRSWLRAEWRCLVPATSFCEWTDSQPKITHWFALDESRPLFAFTGIWRLTGERTGETGEHSLFAFLTTGSNEVVWPIHTKAMPVLLTEPGVWDNWLTGSVDDITYCSKGRRQQTCSGSSRQASSGPGGR
jgi:putative SOS response-associated peptidase YedK